VRSPSDAILFGTARAAPHGGKFSTCWELTLLLRAAGRRPVESMMSRQAMIAQYTRNL